MSIRKIAVLGMGAMGSRMAQAWLVSGYELMVWSRQPQHSLPLQQLGAQVAESPQQAAAWADVVVVMVTDDQASRALWLDAGVLAALQTQAIAIDSSTLSVAWATELAELCQQQQRQLLIAPVLGSRPQLEARQLVYLVGGSVDVLAYVRPLLAEIATSIQHVGQPAQAAAYKLLINGLFVAQVAVMAELLACADAQGLTQLLAVMSSSPVLSPAAKMVATLMQEQNYSPLFPLSLASKDLSYLLALGNHSPHHMPLLARTQAICQQALQQGRGEQHIAVLRACYP